MELYKPYIEDLWFKEKMMDDKQTMSYNHAYGGTISFPKRRLGRLAYYFLNVDL